MKLLLDLDCVLADFVGAVAHRWKMTTEFLLSFQPPGVYDILPPLNRARAALDPSAAPFTQEDFWRDIDGDRRFWANMLPLPWWAELTELAGKIDPDWGIVTTPSYCPDCYAGKVWWVQNKFGREFPHRRLHLTGDKARLARPDTMLIDDNQFNCTTFREAGGLTLLFPAHHNSRHYYKNEPMTLVGPRLRRQPYAEASGPGVPDRPDDAVRPGGEEV